MSVKVYTVKELKKIVGAFVKLTHQFFRVPP